MSIRDTYYNFMDPNYAKRSKEAINDLETFIKKNPDYFETQNIIATTLNMAIKRLDMISNKPANDVSYETREANRVFGEAAEFHVNKVKKTRTKNQLLGATTAVSLLASAFFLPLAIKTIPTSFFASKHIKKSGKDILDECAIAIDENKTRIKSINRKYGGVKLWRKALMEHITEAEEKYRILERYSNDYCAWDNGQKKIYSEYISAINSIGEIEFEVL